MKWVVKTPAEPTNELIYEKVSACLHTENQKSININGSTKYFLKIYPTELMMMTIFSNDGKT